MGGRHQLRDPAAGAQARDPAAGAVVPSSVQPEGGVPGRAEGSDEVTSAAPGGRELAALRREVAALRDEVVALRERLQDTDGELGFMMLTAGRLRGRLDREVEAREALERRLAESGRVVLPEQPGQSPVPSSSRRAAARSGTRSFLTEVDT